MGLTIEEKHRKVELLTGVHLVYILDASLIKGPDKKPLVIKRKGFKEIGITIKFADNNNEEFDNNYYIGGDRERFFKKMCKHAGINLKRAKETGKFRKEAKGKRLFICIKEIHDVNLDKPVVNEVTGEPVINYYIFNTSPLSEPMITPDVTGDPKNNKGVPGGKFIDYRQVGIVEEIEEDDDFDDFANPEVAPKKVKLKSGVVRGNAAFEKNYNQGKNLPQNDDFSTQPAEPKREADDDVIDFDEL